MYSKVYSTLDNLPLTIISVMDASVSQLNETMVEISTEALEDVDNRSRKVGQCVFDRSHDSTPQLGSSSGECGTYVYSQTCQ